MPELPVTSQPFNYLPFKKELFESAGRMGIQLITPGMILAKLMEDQGVRAYITDNKFKVAEFDTALQAMAEYSVNRQLKDQDDTKKRVGADYKPDTTVYFDNESLYAIVDAAAPIAASGRTPTMLDMFKQFVIQNRSSLPAIFWDERLIDACVNDVCTPGAKWTERT